MASIEKMKLLLFKVDSEKAFDSVNWNFLQSIMRPIGFGVKWRNWIASCLSSASISVLINGSLSKEFKLERGLRQGNLLSLFLFLIVVKALQISILEACEKGIYKGIYLANNGANISLKAYLNRLPTRSNLDLRGISLPSINCPFCEAVNEDLDHCIINCSRVLGIWRKVWSWWNLDSPLVFLSFSISDIVLGNVRMHRFCLVYDYVPTGSLEDAMNRMRGDELRLGWDARLKITVGIINELQYIYFTCIPSILHYNLKPSNVLLDFDFEPRLTQCVAH
nr:inactive leucine-rich repeat receptor-like protein kinase CORYNE [Tanacetum cinerariifolium]